MLFEHVSADVQANSSDLPLVEVNGDKLRYQDFCEKMFEWETGIPQRTGGYVCPIQGGEGGEAHGVLKGMGRSRAKFATNIARGLRVNTERKTTFTGYRYSQAKQWDDGDPTNPPDHASGPGSNSAGQEDPTTSDIAVLTSIAMRAVNRRANKHSAVESKQLSGRALGLTTKPQSQLLHKRINYDLCLTTATGYDSRKPAHWGRATLVRSPAWERCKLRFNCLVGIWRGELAPISRKD